MHHCGEMAYQGFSSQHITLITQIPLFVYLVFYYCSLDPDSECPQAREQASFIFILPTGLSIRFTCARHPCSMYLMTELINKLIKSNFHFLWVYAICSFCVFSLLFFFFSRLFLCSTDWPLNSFLQPRLASDSQQSFCFSPHSAVITGYSMNTF